MNNTKSHSTRTNVYLISLFLAFVIGLLLPSLLGSVMAIVVLCIFLFLYEYHTLLENAFILLISNLKKH